MELTLVKPSISEVPQRSNSLVQGHYDEMHFNFQNIWNIKFRPTVLWNVLPYSLVLRYHRCLSTRNFQVPFSEDGGRKQY